MDTSCSPSQELPSDGEGDGLRAAWRHEQQSIAQALAAYYTPLSSTETDDGKGPGGGFELVHYTAKFRKHPPPRSPARRHFFLDDDSVPELGGSRPDRLAGVRPQERVPRRIVEQTCRYCARCPAPPRACAADGRLSGESAEDPLQVGA